MFLSLLKPYEAKVESLRSSGFLVDSAKGKVLDQINSIRLHLRSYKPNKPKTWIETDEYLEELIELIAYLVRDVRLECSFMDGGEFAEHIESRLHHFIKDRLNDAFLKEEIDAELTWGVNVKYLSPKIPPVLDELSALITVIAAEVKDYSERQQKWVEGLR